MSPVGSGFGDYQPFRHKAVSMPKNPLDRCTVVSCLPKHIREVKHTITPGVFELEAAPVDGYSILVVGSSSWFREVDINQPLLEIPVPSPNVAESIVTDYCNGLLGCDMGDVMPGMFYVHGEYTKENILKSPNFVSKLATAQANQKRWYKKLVDIADELWARTNGNPLVISDDSRYGAQLFQLNKAWLQDFQAIALQNCKSCGELINPNYPVCKHCHAVIDVDKAKELNIKFAG